VSDVTDQGGGGGPVPEGAAPERGAPEAEAPDEQLAAPRPLIERIGLFLIALVLAALFGGIALALVAGGELFLGAMAAIGCAMTVWVGGLTLLRG
jgi:hypothetical protein